MGSNVFDQALTIYACTYVKENPTKPLGWAEDFYTGEAVFEWKYIGVEDEEDETDETDDKGKDKNKDKDKDSSLFGK